MKYYIYTTEQTTVDNALNEYSAVASKADSKQADVFYFDKLKNVSAAIGTTHSFLYICIKDSCGNIIKDRELTLGTYLTELPVAES